MKVWYTEHCRLAMQMHQVQELLFNLSHDAIESRADAEARAWADSRRLGPYLDLSLRQEQLHALGREIQLGGQPVFVWLDLIHTNSRAYAQLARQPHEAGIDLLEPILSHEADTLSLWASTRQPQPQVQVSLPHALQPWRELVMLEESHPDSTLDLPSRFAQWIQLRLKEGVEGDLLFLVRSPERLARVREIIARRLAAQTGLRSGATFDLEALPFVQLATLRDFQLDLLSHRAGGAIPELLRRFRLDRHWSFHRFRRRYWQQVRVRMSPELAWEVLRTLLKDSPGGDAPTPERFRRDLFPARESRSPTPEEYRLVYEDIWSKWYRHATERTGWDDQDLARTVLAEAADFPGYVGICIDSELPLTRLELQVVRKLCLLERYKSADPPPPGLQGFAQTPNSGVILVSRLLPHANCHIQIPAGAPARPAWAQLGAKTDALPFTPESAVASPDGPCDIFAIGRTLLQSCFEGRPAWLELLSNTPVILHALNIEDPTAGASDPFLNSLLPPPEHGAIRNLFTVTTAGLLELDVAILYGAGRAFRELLRATVSPQDARIEAFRVELVQAISRVKKALLIVDSEADLAYFWLSQWSPLPKGAIKSLHVEPFWQMELARAWPGVQDSVGSLPLNRFRVEDVALMALKLQQAGLEHTEPQLLRQAAACFTRSGSPKEADIAAALALRHDDNRATAGEVFLRLNLMSEAELDFWEGLQWDALDALYSSGLKPADPIRPMIAAFLRSVKLEGSSGESERPARLGELLPNLQAFLQTAPRLNPASPHWQLLAERLKEDYEVCWDFLLPDQRLALATSVEGLFNTGLVLLAELAGTCWFELGNYARAVNCWEQEGLLTATSYAIAKGFTSLPPTRYRWWLEAREYQRIVEDWRQNPSSDSAVITQVQEAIRQLERYRGREGKRDSFAPQAPITGTSITRLLASVETAALIQSEPSGAKTPGESELHDDEPIPEVNLDAEDAELLCDPVPLEMPQSPSSGAKTRTADAVTTAGTHSSAPSSGTARPSQKGAADPAAADSGTVPPRTASGTEPGWTPAANTKNSTRGSAQATESERQRAFWSAPDVPKTEPIILRPGLARSMTGAATPLAPTASPSGVPLRDTGAPRPPEFPPESRNAPSSWVEPVFSQDDIHGPGFSLEPPPVRTERQTLSSSASSTAPSGESAPGVQSPPAGTTSGAGAGVGTATVSSVSTGTFMHGGQALSLPPLTAPVTASQPSASGSGAGSGAGAGAATAPQPCTLERIEEIRLRNFRAFEDARLSLEDLTLLVGRNGVGVSALADALSFLHDCAVFSLVSALERRGGLSRVMSWEAQNRPAGMTLALVLRLHSAGKGYRVVYGMTLEQDSDGFPGIREERLEVEGANDLGFFRDGLAFYTGLHGVDARPDIRSLILPAIAGAHPVWQGVLRALGRIRVTSLSLSALREGCQRGISEGLEPDGSSAPEVLAALETAPEKMRDLRTRLAAILPDAEDCRTQVSGRRRQLQISLKTREGSARFFDADLLPAGALRVVGWLLALMQQPTPALLFLDGLDEGLHPITLGGLLEDILGRSPSQQVLVSVHGPEALLHTRMTANRVRWVAREDGRSRIYHVQPDALDDDPAELLERFRSDSLPRMRVASMVQGRWFDLEKRSYSTGSGALRGLT